MERNRIMIDQSDYCVFYYDINYLPDPQKSNKTEIPVSQSKSGTKIAYQYAVDKKKNIINMICY